MNNIKTRLFNTVNEESLKESADIIKGGGIVAFPTETVYGLGADALNPNAIEKIFLAKGRPNDNPLIIHIHNISVLDKYVKEIPSVLTMLSKLYMPGPLTVVLKKKDIIPNNVTAGLDTVAVRIPDNEIALKLIEYSNTPIAAPSANISGRPSPTMYEHVVSDLFGKADAIINGGKTRIGLESTVLDLTTEIPVILRPGGVSYESLKLILTDVETAYSFDTEKPKSPGMKYKHYAPIADMVIVKGKTDDVVRKINEISDEDCAVLCCKETYERYISNNKLSAGSINDPFEIASNIFQCLRLFDQMKIKKIFCEYFEMKDIGEAVMNRLLKAASQNIIKV
ncbi:MAG: L-threonylcarbamoyladenylate synthase [Clostridia bacterium]|jgi:L-threonylcarbamoyladenylate synthase|nr:L-threonylcarbamoyladenylate synthase [Clostridia bacterium]MDD3094530.1 L-threonylcarbamoyladenylate synthase [Clostridia bacterium]MDD3970363.1 L-threonylcarbamoyladenylate synthase [Clostridia bacterium]MDD4543092.1 L-threonylcarbamoyladenylate synthase [Clostridia bacterium]